MISFNALLGLSFVGSLLTLFYVSVRPIYKSRRQYGIARGRAGGWDALLDHQRGIGRYAYKHMVYAERRWLADLARQRKVDAVCF